MLLPGHIGRGGEGAVFPVAGEPDLVAKIYHHPTNEHRAKIEFMVAHPPPRPNGRIWTTWPSDLLYTTGPRPTFAGFTMPRLKSAQQIFICYNQTTRQKVCPNFDYRHLVHAVRNLAAAFGLAHKHQLVIGDANESNIFIGNDALTIIIDSDSWQITDASSRRVYRSAFAKPDFLPPELQGRNLSKLNRQPWHDNFALGVLLFKLVNEGCHPCDGVFHGRGDVPPLEARIAAGTFPYFDSSGMWSPKPSAVPFDSLHPRLQELFVQTFVSGHSNPQARPDAATWQRAFSVAERELQRCHRNSNHWFWGNDCIWCQRKALLGGRDPFPDEKPKARTMTPRTARAASSRQATWSSPSPSPSPSSRKAPDGLFTRALIAAGEFVSRLFP